MRVAQTIWKMLQILTIVIAAKEINKRIFITSVEAA
jgi:hypothetical protein